MLEDAKVRFLFEKVQHAGLQLQIESLKASIMTGAGVLCKNAANHLITSVSQLP